MTRDELMALLCKGILIRDICPRIEVRYKKECGKEYLIKNGNGYSTHCNYESPIDLENFRQLFYIMMHQDRFTIKLYDTADDYEGTVSKRKKKAAESKSSKSKSVFSKKARTQLKPDAILNKAESFFEEHGIKVRSIKQYCDASEYGNILCNALINHILPAAFFISPSQLQAAKKYDDITDKYENARLTVQAELFRLQFQKMRSQHTDIRINDSRYRGIEYTHEVPMIVDRKLPSYTKLSISYIILPLKLDEYRKQLQQMIDDEQNCSRYDKLVRGFHNIKTGQDEGVSDWGEPYFMEHESDEARFPLSDQIPSTSGLNFSDFILVTRLTDTILRNNYPNANTQEELKRKLFDDTICDVENEIHNQYYRYYSDVVTYLNNCLQHFMQISFSELLEDHPSKKACVSALNTFHIDAEFVFSVVSRYEENEEDACRFVADMILKAVYEFTQELDYKKDTLGSDVHRHLHNTAVDLQEHCRIISDFLSSKDFAKLAAQPELQLSDGIRKYMISGQPEKDADSMTDQELIDSMNNAAAELGKPWVIQNDIADTNCSSNVQNDSQISRESLNRARSKLNEIRSSTQSAGADEKHEEQEMPVPDIVKNMFAVLKRALEAYKKGLNSSD